jgi:hypothetical protein
MDGDDHDGDEEEMVRMHRMAGTCMHGWFVGWLVGL